MKTILKNYSIKATFTFLVIVMATNVFSQDKIYLKNGEKINGKIEEVGPDEIKYKKNGNLDGPSYVIRKNDIDSINFSSGGSEYYSTKNESGNSVKDFNSNTVSINLVALLVNQVQLDVKHVFEGGKIGVSVPIVFRTSDDLVGSFSTFSAKWMTGLELVLIPSGQKPFMYNLGIGFNTGQLSILDEQYVQLYDPTSGQPTGYSKNQLVDYNFYGFSINNSLEYCPAKWISVNVGLNIGFNRVFGNYSSNQYSYRPNFHVFARPELAVGFKF